MYAVQCLSAFVGKVCPRCQAVESVQSKPTAETCIVVTQKGECYICNRLVLTACKVAHCSICHLTQDSLTSTWRWLLVQSVVSLLYLLARMMPWSWGFGQVVPWSQSTYSIFCFWKCLTYCRSRCQGCQRADSYEFWNCCRRREGELVCISCAAVCAYIAWQIWWYTSIYISFNHCADWMH